MCAEKKVKLEKIFAPKKKYLHHKKIDAIGNVIEFKKKVKKSITLLLFKIIISKNIIIAKKIIYATLAFPVCEPL